MLEKCHNNYKKGSFQLHIQLRHSLGEFLPFLCLFEENNQKIMILIVVRHQYEVNDHELSKPLEEVYFYFHQEKAHDACHQDLEEKCN